MQWKKLLQLLHADLYARIIHTDVFTNAEAHDRRNSYIYIYNVFVCVVCSYFHIYVYIKNTQEAVNGCPSTHTHWVYS